jgi:putative glutamine amidotransferase
MPRRKAGPRIAVILSRKSSPRTLQNYLDAVARAGGEAVPLYCDQDSTEELENSEALLLCGGGDVNPEHYRQVAHEALSGVDDQRDEFEFRAISRVQARAMPIMAICRGHQVLNVALGGSLDQHIAEGHAAVDSSPHRPSSWHDVEIEPQSQLHGVYGVRTATVNSRHHQGIRPEMLAAGLKATAWSDDGFVEAYESDGGRVISVQWHPERVEEDAPSGFNERSALLFDHFVRLVSEASAARTPARQPVESAARG